MQVTLKLFASLADYLPPDSRDNRVALEVDAAATVAEVIARQQLPERLVHLVLVNGVYVAPADRTTRTLQAGDQLALWPPIAGG